MRAALVILAGLFAFGAIPMFPTMLTAVAQTEPVAPPEPQLSKDCQTPGLAMSGVTPLPNLALALKDRKVLKILSIGASSKAGKASRDAGYFSLVEGILEKTLPGIDVQIIDRGVSGELARDAAERLRTEVALAGPDLVLWQLGTHDALMQVPVDEFKATVSEALDWFKPLKVDVVIVGLHYLRKMATDPHYQAIRQALNRTVEEKKVLRISRYEAMQVIEQARTAGNTPLPNEFMTTEAGYSCLAEYIVRAVTTGIFAKPPRNPPRG